MLMPLSKPKKNLIAITVITLFCLYLTLPANLGRISIPRINLKIGSLDLSKEVDIKQGLDIKGGTQIVLDTDTTNIPDSEKLSALESLKDVVSRRVDLFGVSESTVKTLQTNQGQRLLIELPGVTDANQAIKLIGETAKLDFAYPVFSEPKNASDEAVLSGFNPAGLTGADLKRAQVTFETDNSLPAVSIEFNDNGTKKFAQITKENIGKPLAILLDGYPITMPNIQTEIPNGQAIITGNFALEEAKDLAIKLNAGALPVPVKVISQKNIPATLGQESVNKSLLAGGVGLLMVVTFMVLYYGKLGTIASLGLLLYGLYTITLYKLIPVVLTLPGIAGFVLSMGMAVDSNILIFERYKEEIRAGRSWQVALELAFGRAWDSIKDANTATIITALILFNPLNWPFLNTSGSVRGFALTLIIGIAVSLFTGIFVTRNLLRVFYKGKNQVNKKDI